VRPSSAESVKRVLWDNKKKTDKDIGSSELVCWYDHSKEGGGGRYCARYRTVGC
jgi:hypothetical protein